MMGENSRIEWTDHTFNPWVGCCKVSLGCKFCYAERDMTRKPRWANTWGPPETSERLRTKTWGNPVKWNRRAEETGKLEKVFCASLADVFEANPQVAGWRDELIELIVNTPYLDWLVLTKRPTMAMMYFNDMGYVPYNLWIGVSVEDQMAVDERIPTLLQIPAAVRFVSAEPLLGSLNIQRYLLDGWHKFNPRLHWVIAGTESGPQRRPADVAWFRSLRDQCRIADTPFFLKQMEIDGKVVKMPELDGRVWAEFPDRGSDG